jgi:hypothetical protein
LSVLSLYPGHRRSEGCDNLFGILFAGTVIERFIQDAYVYLNPNHMNKHLLSVIVLIAFAFFALFPASSKSITDRPVVVKKHPKANNLTAHR